MIGRIGYGILAAAVLAGCAVDQKKEVATYRKVLGEQTRPVAATFAAGQPLSLTQALSLANEQNENLGLRGEDYLQALINKDRAVAAFLPTVAVNLTHARQGGSGANDPATDIPAVLEFGPFTGARELAAYRFATATIEQRRATLLDAQASVLLGVAQTYYLVLRAERSVEVLTNSLSVQEERVKFEQAQLTVGRARLLDVAQSQAQAAGTRALLVQSQSDVRNGRSLLAFLTASPVQNSRLTDAFDLPATLPALADAQRIAHAMRQDLQAARAAAVAARQAVEVAYGAYWPSVSVNLEYWLSRDSTPTGVTWLGIFNVNVPIFTAGLIEANVRTTWSQFRQAKLTESLTGRQVTQEVEIAYQNIQASQQRIVSLRSQVAANQEALRLAEGLARAGQGIYLDVLTAQNQLQSAQLDLSNEEFDLKASYLNLVRVSGELSTRVPGEPTTQPVHTTLPATMPTTQR